MLKVAVVCEDLGEGVPAHDVHGNAVGEAIMFIRALFIEGKAFEK